MNYEEKWMKVYDLAKEYYEKHGDLLIPQNYTVMDGNENKIRLGVWLNNQRQAYKKSKISEEKIKLLEKIGMIWEVKGNYERISLKWLKKYELAKQYYEEHGDLLIPEDYVVTDEESNKIRLGEWILNQRRAYRKSKISEEKIRLLEKIGMIWKVKGNDDFIFPNWLKKYELAKKYYEEHSNLLIPWNYVVTDDKGTKINLGNWINVQRSAYKGEKGRYINSKQIELLNKIGMIWEVKGNDELISPKWLKNYELAKKYYEEHGNLLIPYDYVTTDDKGIKINLGDWVNTQRRAYKGEKGRYINSKQIELLNKIGMIWKIKSNDDFISPNWLKNYELAKKYYEEHGNLLIPSDYVTTDESNQEVNLGTWICTQRKAYKGKKGYYINFKQIELLNEINMAWNKEEYYKKTKDMGYISPIWLKKYKLAKKYYEEHGNLLIPYDYVTTDESNQEVNLGTWICTQRKAYKGKKGYYINFKQIELLNEINMAWNKEEYYKKTKDMGYISPIWLKKYELAKKYYEEHGNLLIPTTYIATDESNQEVNLGAWIRTQRNAYKEKDNHKINTEQIKLLDEIKMIWNVQKYKKILRNVEEQYYLYQYGLLEQRNIDDLIKEKVFEYDDSCEIVKGNAIVLSRKR